MDVTAVAASGVTDGAVATGLTSPVAAAPFATVNLGEMIASRMSGAAGGTAAIGAGGFGLGLSQTPGILRASERLGGRVGSGDLQVPAVLQAYGNGRIPREMLTPIGIGQHRMWSVAADAFITMRAAAAAEGVDIGVTDSYRTYDQQVELAARKGLWKDGGYAAVPGTSPHGWGLALDVDVDSKGLAWIRANGGRFGFVETTPREPWHWEYRGATS